MTSNTHSGDDRDDRLGSALAAVVAAQRERPPSRTLAAVLRQFPTLLMPAAVGVWLYVLLLFALG